MKLKLCGLLLTALPAAAVVFQALSGGGGVDFFSQGGDGSF